MLKALHVILVKRYLFFICCPGSISELETQLIISHHLEYISEELLETFFKKILEIKNMTIGLIRYLSRQ
ncbi:four helix bundle protein [Fidelibacter multiformis]|uniref:four helix bundle protein n=1 Tax=Fidelibacter multiformis TaxID=3377529 RepID=UPI0037DDA8B0